METLLAKLKSQEAPIGVVGLGYVGLPLACLLASKYKVIGFDINATRVTELKAGKDHTGEIRDLQKLRQPSISFTNLERDLATCPLIIVAVPTPVDQFKKPDLGPVISASKTVGRVLSKSSGAIAVFESTVYPGVTESVCRQHIEQEGGLVYLRDFYLGYSPERVNPGDEVHTIDKITKVVSGSTPDVCQLLAEVYGSVIPAGIHQAPNIATAEAAKVIENTQRDLNIALINELALIFEKIGLDSRDVLAAAQTKWNFLNFRPGLVGGHCIGVDPYYLTYLAEGVGVHPQVISAGRRINDAMAGFVAQKVLRLIMNERKSTQPGQTNVVVLGVTFKENVPDLRNSKVIDLLQTLEDFGVNTHAVDPIANADEYYGEYGRKLSVWDDVPPCDAVILAVRHHAILEAYPLAHLSKKLKQNSKIVADIQGVYDRNEAKDLKLNLWRL